MSIEPAARLSSFPEACVVSYPGGSCQEESQITGLLSHPEKKDCWFLFSRQTPFHPMNPKWPDQPGDWGWVLIEGRRYPIEHCWLAAVEATAPDQKVYIHTAIPREAYQTEGWVFLVAHEVVCQEEEVATWLGKEVVWLVDAVYRGGLSAGHSACHLSALALNQVAAPFWKKEVQETDSLGHPDLDRLAIFRSNITPNHSDDFFRLGKSLQKKGFAAEHFLSCLDEVKLAVNQLLADWLSQRIHIYVLPGVSLVNSRRTWHCQIGDKLKAELPCGGTHLVHLDNVKEIKWHVAEETSICPDWPDGKYIGTCTEVVWQE